MGKIADRIMNKGTKVVAITTKREPQHAPIAGNRPDDDYPRYDVQGPLSGWEIGQAFEKRKYISVLHPQLGPVAVTFPGWLVHADVYGQLRYLRGSKLLGAGFYRIDDGKATLYGRSESLDKGITDGDALLVEQALGLM